MPRKRNPRHLLKGAEAPLDGVAALLKRAAARLNSASAYVGDGDSSTAYERFINGVELLDLATKEIATIARTYISEDR